MQGLGNDFIIIDNRNKHISKLSSHKVKQICNRKYGIGCDQLIIINESKEYDCELAIYNSDGSKADACGNGTRCVAYFLEKEKSNILVNMKVIKAAIKGQNLVNLSMGKPIFEAPYIPVNKSITDPLSIEFKIKGFELGAAVNVGNPHVVFFIDSLNNINFAYIAQQILNKNYFPEGVNINFAHIVNKKQIKLVVWERGVGLTRACGTGACATYAVASNLNIIDKNITVHQEGGALALSKSKSNEIEMTGEAKYVFSGEIKL